MMTIIRGASHSPYRHDIDSIVVRIWMRIGSSVTTSTATSWTNHSCRIECSVAMIVSQYLVMWMKRGIVFAAVVVVVVTMMIVVVVVVRDASYYGVMVMVGFVKWGWV